jgi:two-component system OmpR family sensor kinase
MNQSGLEPARALVTLQRLLEIPAADLNGALIHAANALADAFAADKVDAFLYDEKRDSLVALGTSTQPLSNLQKNLGLDVLQISNGGRVVHVYKTGQVFRTGNLQADPEELPGIKEGLKIQSKLGVPLFIGNRLRGMLMIASLKPDFFTEADESFVKGAATWVGMVAHRAELMEEIARTALEQGRRAAADELVTVLAHDIRNYLAPISGWLHVLRSDSQARGDEQRSRHAESALRGVRGLSTLVTSLLDVARIDRGLFELDIEPVDLGVLAREAADNLSSAEHEVVVNASGSILVAADRARVRQCIDNLISNAAGHSPRGSPVNIFIQQYENEGRGWGQLEVVDQGPGIATDLLPHLFDRFVTGRAKSGGVGLGLYFASRVVQAHGGRITVESAPGKGARFTLHLPLFRPPEDSSATSPSGMSPAVPR